MRRPFLCLSFLLLPALVPAQDCTLTQYQKLLTEADQATAKGQYDLAINKLQSAKTCRPEKEEQVSRKILVVFDKVNGERQAAIRNADEARRQAEIAGKNEARAIMQEGVAQKNAEEARKNAAEAERQSVIAKAEQAKAEAEARRVFANAIAYKSQTALSGGDRNTAFRLALSAYRFVDSNNINVTQALANALYYNENARVVPQAWNEQTLQGHTDHVVGVAFSPDGKRLATASEDNTVKIWDLKSGKNVLTLSGHKAGIKGIAYSPDGSKLATCSYDNTAKVWDVLSGAMLLNLKHVTQVRGVAFSPDGKKLATACLDAIIWDISTGKSISTLGNRKENVLSVAFSPDGSTLATGSIEKHIKIWDLNTGKLISTLSGHQDRVVSTAFSPDGTKLASGSFDHTAIVWDLRSKKVIHTLEGHINAVIEVAFSPDGTRLATGSNDHTAKIWDLQSGKTILMLSPHLYRDILWTGNTDGLPVNRFSIAVSPDGTKLATSSLDYTAKIWDLDIRKDSRILTGHSQGINGVAFLPHGNAVATISADKTARVWDLNTGKNTCTFQGQNKPLTCLAISPDGRLLAAGAEDKTVKIWDLSNGENIRTLYGHADEITGVAFSPDGKKLASGSYETVKIYDLNKYDSLVISWPGKSVTDLVFSPDGARLAVSFGAVVAKIWDLNTQKEILTILDSTHTVRSIAFHPDGKHIATTGMPGYAHLVSTVKIWDLNAGKAVLTINDYPDHYDCVTFSPDGQRFAAGSSEIARVWDISGTELLTLKAHTYWVKALAFSPDSKRLATGSNDQTAKIWELFPEEMVAIAAKNHRLAEFIPRQLEAYDLTSLLDIRPQNESILLATRETWQIAAFADLYAQNIAESGFPKKTDFERALRLYEACLSHNVDNAYFQQKISALNAVWATKTEGN